MSPVIFFPPKKTLMAQGLQCPISVPLAQTRSLSPKCGRTLASPKRMALDGQIHFASMYRFSLRPLKDGRMAVLNYDAKCKSRT